MTTSLVAQLLVACASPSRAQAQALEPFPFQVHAPFTRLPMVGTLHSKAGLFGFLYTGKVTAWLRALLALPSATQHEHALCKQCQLLQPHFT